MNHKIILFIGYWSANDGLTSATIIPHLKILSELKSVSKIIFCSIEREKNIEFNIDIFKVHHKPLYSSFDKIPIINKISDFVLFPQKLKKLCEIYNVSHIIARGAVAGALAYKTWVKTNIPFYVESYEPHAAYMLESGVWSSFDPRFIMQKRWEKKQNKYATALMPVANNYKEELIHRGINTNRIDVIPCCVPLDKFAFNELDRDKVRKSLKIPLDATVGIYVGKYGGLYYDHESFHLFKENMEQQNLFIILLTPQLEYVIEKLKETGIPQDRCHVLSVKHSEVPKYLSASNFAYALYRPAPSKKSLSPIKIGEYWANGLPVIVPDGIGDDSKIIRENNIGCIYSENEAVDFEKINSIDRETIMKIALKYRSFNIVKKVYERWYDQ